MGQQCNKTYLLGWYEDVGRFKVLLQAVSHKDTLGIDEIAKLEVGRALCEDRVLGGQRVQILFGDATEAGDVVQYRLDW